MEQSTAKKDKFEQKFKNACNNIEPINLLSNKNENNQAANVDKKEKKEKKENKESKEEAKEINEEHVNKKK